MRILLLCLVFFVSILLVDKIVVVSGQCLGDQRSQLLQLKNSLLSHAPESTKLIRWNQNSDCCSWDGVTCDEEGHVTGLSLGRESISRGLDNSTLFDLRYLRSLDLSYNNFNDAMIPEMIGNLTGLIYLNLSNAGFGGLIPRAMSRLTSLVTLDLSTSPLFRISLLKPNLRMLIQNLSKLEELYLDGLDLSAHGSEWCQIVSSSLPYLRVLSLAFCHLSGPLDSSLRNLRSLSEIRLNDNKLSSPVPKFFSSFSNLTSLHLGFCGLHGTFPSEIFQVSTLRVIDVSYNRLLRGFLHEFPVNSSLQQLFLGSTSFSGSLPSSIGNLGKLSTLDVYNCQFSGALPNSMAELTQLVSLDLSRNMFSGPIPPFKTSKNLTKVVLSHNSFRGAITSAHWDGLNNLVRIDLQNNLLNGTIPSSIFALPSLEELQLSDNRFEGQLPQIRNISSRIDTLHLSSNDLEGPIPTSIFDLQNLVALSLSSNRLSGTVQLDRIQGLHNLNDLDLSYNNLSVTVGDQGSTWSAAKLSTLNLASCNLKTFPNLQNQSKLVNLDLSSNQISGEIPAWIWGVGNGTLANLNLSYNSLKSIQQPYTIPMSFSVLDLHSNHIGGSIPVLPPSASYIDFSSNNFTSVIPSEIGNNLSMTIFFSVSNNKLMGNLPESICKAANIQVLDLSNNSLSGPIPDCIASMSQTVGVLNLQRNHFTGSIPDAFDAYCSLKTLDLSRNSLQGKLPESLANCVELEVLNLGNNNLSDKFPCGLKNISALRVLILRSNNFHGTIGCSRTNALWKTLQILDIAHNNFGGEIPRTFLSNWTTMQHNEHGSDSDSGTKHIRYAILLFSNVYYKDSVTVTGKGVELEVAKILTIFTSIDLSSNNLTGPIPDEIGVLRALYILNLSHNSLTSRIPSTIGNLRNLESLDLSWNSLTGTIPASLAQLNFLSFLNLSFNHLVGSIPKGSQLQTFSEDSYLGNPGLCMNCTDNVGPPPPGSNDDGSESEIDWALIIGLVGFLFGFVGVVWPVVFVKRWREIYFGCIDAIGARIYFAIAKRFNW